MGERSGVAMFGVSGTNPFVLSKPIYTDAILL